MAGCTTEAKRSEGGVLMGTILVWLFSSCFCLLSAGLACLIAADMVLRHRAEAAVSEAVVSVEEISGWLSSMWYGVAHLSLMESAI